MLNLGNTADHHMFFWGYVVFQSTF